MRNKMGSFWDLQDLLVFNNVWQQYDAFLASDLYFYSPGLNNNKAQPAQRRVRGELLSPYEFMIIILVANTQDNQPTTFWFLHFQHDGTEVGTPLRQGRVHWLQARPPQPTREHRSPEGRGYWRKGRRQVVHRQEMRIRLQGKQWPKTCDVLRRDKNRFAISIT